MKEKLKAQGSKLHALVNNAAISPKKPGGGRLNTLETAEQDWKTVFQINFFAPVMLARGLMDELVAAKGAVVNVTSIAGSRVHPFAGAAYSTSKAALASLTREMAADFGPFGVRVNSISPGEIETSILSPGTEKLVAQIPQRRLGQPEEATGAVVPPIYLSSTYARDENYVPKLKENYVRAGNPTLWQTEEAIAALEGGSSALLFASGMSAITTLFET
eukprot:gene27281-27533_t